MMDLEKELKEAGGDPAKVVEENFSIKQTLEELLQATDEQVATGFITLETANTLREIYRAYLSGNTPASFTTNIFNQMTAVKLTFILFKVLAHDYYRGRDLNSIIAYVSSVVDMIVLGLNRSLGGKERTLILGRVNISNNPFMFSDENQQNNKIFR